MDKYNTYFIRKTFFGILLALLIALIVNYKVLFSEGIFSAAEFTTNINLSTFTTSYLFHSWNVHVSAETINTLMLNTFYFPLQFISPNSEFLMKAKLFIIWFLPSLIIYFSVISLFEVFLKKKSNLFIILSGIILTLSIVNPLYFRGFYEGSIFYPFVFLFSYIVIQTFITNATNSHFLRNALVVGISLSLSFGAPHTFLPLVIYYVLLVVLHQLFRKVYNLPTLSPDKVLKLLFYPIILAFILNSYIVVPIITLWVSGSRWLEGNPWAFGKIDYLVSSFSSSHLNLFTFLPVENLSDFNFTLTSKDTLLTFVSLSLTFFWLSTLFIASTLKKEKSNVMVELIIFMLILAFSLWFSLGLNDPVWSFFYYYIAKKLPFYWLLFQYPARFLFFSYSFLMIIVALILICFYSFIFKRVIYFTFYLSALLYLFVTSYILSPFLLSGNFNYVFTSNKIPEYWHEIDEYLLKDYTHSNMPFRVFYGPDLRPSWANSTLSYDFVWTLSVPVFSGFFPDTVVHNYVNFLNSLSSEDFKKDESFCKVYSSIATMLGIKYVVWHGNKPSISKTTQPFFEFNKINSSEYYLVLNKMYDSYAITTNGVFIVVGDANSLLNYLKIVPMDANKWAIFYFESPEKVDINFIGSLHKSGIKVFTLFDFSHTNLADEQSLSVITNLSNWIATIFLKHSNKSLNMSLLKYKYYSNQTNFIVFSSCNDLLSLDTYISYKPLEISTISPSLWKVENIPPSNENLILVFKERHTLAYNLWSLRFDSLELAPLKYPVYGLWLSWIVPPHNFMIPSKTLPNAIIYFKLEDSLRLGSVISWFSLTAILIYFTFCIFISYWYPYANRKAYFSD